MVPLGCSCPCPIAQITESTVPFTICPGYVSSANSASSPGLHPGELVLVEERDDLPVRLDEGHHGVQRQSGDECAGPELQVDDVTLARRHGRGLVEQPARVRELRSDLRDLRVRAVDVGAELLLDLPDRRQRLRFGRSRCSLLAARRFTLPHELGEIGLRLLEVEARACAGFRELTVLLDAHACEREPCVHFRDFRARLRDRRACFHHFGVRARQGLRGLALPALREGELRLQVGHVELVGRRVDLEQHVTLVNEAVALLDGHFQHAATDLRDDRDHVLEHA